MSAAHRRGTLAGEHAEPPDWTTIVHYIRALQEGGTPGRRIPHHIEAIGETYQGRGLENPTSHERVRAELAGLLEPPSEASTRSETLPGPGASEANVPLREVSNTALTTQEAPGRMLTAAQFHALTDVPAALVWLENIENANTRRAYQGDVEAFVSFCGIEQPEELRLVTRAHVIA